MIPLNSNPADAPFFFFDPSEFKSARLLHLIFPCLLEDSPPQALIVSRAVFLSKVPNYATNTNYASFFAPPFYPGIASKTANF